MHVLSRRQTELAIKYKKPLFLHERDAHAKFVEVFVPYKDKVKGIVHCFTGTSADLKEYLDIGLYIGIAGWVCDEEKQRTIESD